MSLESETIAPIQHLNEAARGEAAALSQVALSDAELEQVAGGSSLGLFISISTVGIMCALVSIRLALSNESCGDALGRPMPPEDPAYAQIRDRLRG